MNRVWRTAGRVLAPDPSVAWLGDYSGSTAACPPVGSRVELYVSGRDRCNRSHIGRVWVDLSDPERPPVIEAEPVLTPGGRGAFDDSGVSYPCVVGEPGRRLLYYTGWRRAVSTPFQNDLGLAVERPDGRFERLSRAPIFPRTDADHLSIGSVHVLADGDRWRMWYTSWTDWGDPDGDGPPHRYLIKYAESDDGISWEPHDHIAIGPRGDDEHSLCSPSVVVLADGYHMWFCARGAEYRIEHATSVDGRSWVRSSEPESFDRDHLGLDDEARAYPTVVRSGRRLVMFYSGNGYGRGGLGLAEAEIQR